MPAVGTAYFELTGSALYLLLRQSGLSVPHNCDKSAITQKNAATFYYSVMDYVS